MKRNANILLIYTGGTIGMVKDYQTGTLRAFNFAELISNIPEINQLNCNLEGISFEEPIDSSNMNPTHWVKIASLIEKHYREFDGFVVLHGSDTMSYSGSALSFMLENLTKPVIFTGSQLPIGDLRTDAKENLITSIEIASLLKNGQPLVQEVCLYFEYKLYRANRTTKISAEHFDAFVSLNFPPLGESGVHLKINEPLLFKNPKSNVSLKVHQHMDDRVGVLKLFPGMNGLFLKATLGVPNLKALVLETYGAGNAPLDEWFLSSLTDAVNKGLYLINVTQCSGGSVAMGQYETSAALLEIGVINGKDITTEAALAKAMYLLGVGIENDKFKTFFEAPLRGEMH